MKFHVTGRELYIKFIKKADNIWEIFKPISKAYKADLNNLDEGVRNSKKDFFSFIAGKESQKFDNEIYKR